VKKEKKGSTFAPKEGLYGTGKGVVEHGPAGSKGSLFTRKKGKKKENPKSDFYSPIEGGLLSYAEKSD